MVSKITVMALVVIVAVPILLGYALNFEETEETRYDRSETVTNVTPLLQSGTEYTYTSANSYEMNAPGDNEYPLWYLKRGTAYSSLYEYQEYTTPAAATTYVLSDYSYLSLVSRSTANSVAVLDSSNNQLAALNGWSIEWDGNRLMFDGTVPNLPTAAKLAITIGRESLITYKYVTTGTSEAAAQGIFVDMAGGWRIIRPNAGPVNLNLPAPASEVLLTIDLAFDSAVAGEEGTTQIISNGLYGVALAKPAGSDHWRVQKVGETDYIDLPVTPDDLSVYQLKLTPSTATLYYVGGWPAQFGAANVYKTYDLFTVDTSDSDFSTLAVTSGGVNYAVSHRMRIDSATVRSATYNIIQDTTYAPSQIQINPYTKLDVAIAGTSLSFGGSTYAVSNGTISVEGKRMNVNGIVMDSVPNGDSFDNRINGTVVSTTAEPSTIAFNGKWGANVTTGTITESTVTVNKWVAGGFAFNGIDNDFALLGLVTAAAAFIGLGLYGRRSGAKVGTLMLVCGACAAVFLCLIV